MWPKLLLDLLPHFSRLLPVADKYLARISANEKAQAAALTALAEGVRGELGQVTEAQAGLSRQLQQQSAQIADVAVDVARARMGVESVEERVAGLEKSMGMAVKLLLLAVVLMAIAVTLLVVRMVR
jgi:chromosome segregation ATPase